MSTLRIVIMIALTTIITMNHAQTYRDSTASIDERVEDLLSRMTLAEKIGQMTQADRGALASDSDITTYFLGSLLSGGGSAPANNSPVGWANMYDNFQAKALETRLGIPLIYGIDAVHGHNNVRGAVIFPHNIGLGATRNPDLVREVTRITALEVAGTGIDWTFAPCIAVPRNISWGRTYEGFGETPELQSMMAAPAVSGFQGDSLSHQQSILACAKHFVGDGGTTNGVDQGNTQIDEATLRTIHLPGYIAAINAGLGSIMASYNSWNGAKLHGHQYLLTEVLKTELGFKGFVVSDWAGIDQLPGDYPSDVKQSINAGIDMVMTPYNYEEFISTLTALVNSGMVAQSRIDDAVRRILYQKFALGLFEKPYTNRNFTALIGSAEHRAVGRQAVRESMVLLAQKDGILPLQKSGQKILVAGRHANNIGFQCGGWSISWQGGSGNITSGTTILQAIENTVAGSDVVFSQDGSGISDADIAVVAIGEEPYAEGGGDSHELFFRQEDINSVLNLKNSGMKVIVIVISGRPLILEPILPYTDAIFAAWLPGTEAQGITDILFADYQPSGKLGHSWPRSMDQVPINIGDEDYDPLFAYGHGLTAVGDRPPGTSPEFYSGAVSAGDTSLHISFTRALDISNLSPSDFLVSINGFAAHIDSTAMVAGDEKTLLLYLQEAIVAEDKVSCEYVGSSLQSIDGALVASFGPEPIYNALDGNNSLFRIPGKIEAEDYYQMAGIQTEVCTDEGGGLNVGWIDAGDWLSYQIDVLQSGEYIMKYRVASLVSGGKATAKLDDVDLATTTFPVTGGWQAWTTVEQRVTLEGGVGILKIFCDEGGFNINWIALETPTTSIEPGGTLPAETALMQNYPNPFNPQTKIRFNIARPVNVVLEMYDIRGSLVKTLANGYHTPGRYEVIVMEPDLPSGVYFYRLTAGDFSEIKKMMLVK